ncbi:hypothetical protein Q5M49_01895 [Acinetobacter nosocomialis]|uniref:hypothetical protein n=1 Tax=Acinetobacter nosocomialis TaxID=106654 RepID=UPI002287E1B2|nr:hypothetical protein [Acinetobacter nosocomialis]MDO7509522.1 hypothetical protein [Acinetobacter baumannii]MDO7192442.1 hypothetical protein [Acinetobacter nosocomialis]MDV7627613.1 hypothetical protein [Acinetobacter baumannii]MDV7648815.1 hypothetical protein [Acinetobacter baumannii]MDV7652984.1 hypothetical protein [Acinetobacter baumannii]
MLKNIDLENEKREELGKQMVEDLVEIAKLEQRLIKHFKADKNGVFLCGGNRFYKSQF